MKRINFVFATIVLFSVVGFAQNGTASYPSGAKGAGGSSPTTSASATSTSSSNSSATTASSSTSSGNMAQVGNVTNNLDLGNAKSTVEAPSGSIGPVGPIAAIVPNGQGPIFFEPGASIPKDEIAWNARGVKFHGLDVNPDPKRGVLHRVESNDPNVHLINWSPMNFVIPNSGDWIIASVRLYGGELSNPTGAIYAALSRAVEISGSTRCAVQLKPDIAVEVKGFAFGFGASVSHASADNPLGVGGGAGFGKNKTTTPDSPDVEVFCLNNHEGAVNFYVPPPTQPQVQAQSNSNPNPNPNSQQLSDLADAIRRLKDEIKGLKQPPPVPTSSDTCPNLAHLGYAYHFDHYKANLVDNVVDDKGRVVFSNNRSQQATLHQYLMANPACNIEFLGNASSEGPYPLNDHLAQERALNVYRDFVDTFKDMSSRVCAYASAGKHFADQNDVVPGDRKVVVRRGGAFSDNKTGYCSE